MKELDEVGFKKKLIGEILLKDTIIKSDINNILIFENNINLDSLK